MIFTHQDSIYGKIALLYPENKFGLSGCNPPYALLSLATALVRQGIGVKIFDVDAYAGKHNLLLKDVQAYAPDITGIPLFFSSFNSVFELLKLMQEHTIGGTVVLGGPEVTADPDNVFACYPSLQFGFMGEADESFVQFIHAYLNKRDVYNIPGLVYRDGGRVIKNEPVLIKDINSLPEPDHMILRENYKRGLYWRLGCRGTTAILLSSRGCPYACKFCFKVTRQPRYRSAESVHKEIEQILSMGIKNIHFMDDLLVIHIKRVKEIFDPIDPKLGIKFKVRARANLVTEEIVEYLASKGITEIVCGYESGSNKLLKLMNKGTTAEQNVHAIKTIKKYGIKAFADIMFMYPGENMNTARETVQFIKNAKPSYVNWCFLGALNGTPVALELKSKGLLEGKYSVKQVPRIIYDYLTPAEHKHLIEYISKEMDRYNRNLSAVLLPNLIDILLSSGYTQYKAILHHYRQSMFPRLF